MGQVKKEKRVVKGTPTAVVISILIHAGLFFLAGMFVVFTVVKQKEVEFAPPKAVERPKMKLKKPKVRIKKSSKPKPTTRIVTKVQKTSMPDIQLPEMSGMAEGLAGGDIGFDLMPDLDSVSIFGGEQSIGNDFEGVVYDFKRDRNGGTPTVALSAEDSVKFKEYVEKFIESGWKTSSVARFYKSPRKLYSPMIMIPPITSALGPWAFGEREMYPYQYMLYYKGQLVHKDAIRFRFVVMGDNFLLIRLDGKVVMDYKNQFENVLPGKSFKPLNYHLGHWYAYASDWIDLEPGVPKQMEVIAGDYKGGLFAAMIAVQVDGVDYPRAPLPQDNPVLPIFKTAELTRDQIDAVYEFMWEGHLSLTNGPVFSDYDTSGSSLPSADAPSAEPEPAAPVDTGTELRTWTLNNGKSIEAKYVTLMGGRVVLKSKRGKVIKVPPSEFSEEDSNLLELLDPPDLRMDFKRDTSNFKVLYNPNTGMAIPTAQEFAGGVLITQQNMKKYTHPLRVELYVIADEYDGNNFILLDRQIKTFTPTPEGSFEFYGKKKILRRYENYGGTLRGEKYKGYMILVYDERGVLIAQNLSHDWLLDIVEKLRVFPVGRHFNKQGERVHPPRPKFSDRFWDMSSS